MPDKTEAIWPPENEYALRKLTKIKQRITASGRRADLMQPTERSTEDLRYRHSLTLAVFRRSPDSLPRLNLVLAWLERLDEVLEDRKAMAVAYKARNPTLDTSSAADADGDNFDAYGVEYE